MLDSSVHRGALAVIIPMYGHAGLVAESIHSVRRSIATGLCIDIIVSVDGDPQSETFDVLLAEAAVDDRLHVIFAENGGPGAARNRAIDFALDLRPDLDAIYFLDADNRLLPGTLGKLWRHKQTSGAHWVYTNIDTFAVNWTAHYGDRYSRLTHCITDNICDTGALVDAAVFRSGLRFAESRENGFEDWEFWLSCIRAGFVGTPCPGTAFEYRLRAESRFKEANRQRSSAIGFLRKRNRSLFRRDTLVGFEHEDAPRYALLLAGTGEVQFLTDPRLPPRTLGISEATQRYWAARAEPDNHHFPPFLLCCTPAVWTQLQQSRLLPNLLSRIEQITEEKHVAFLELTNDRGEISIRVQQNDSGLIRERACDLAAVRTALLDDVIQNNGLDWFRSMAARQVWLNSATLTARLPLTRRIGSVRAVPAEQALAGFADLLAADVFRCAEIRRWTWRQPMLCSGRNLHLELRRDVDGAPVLPLGPAPDGRRTAAVLTPIASFGGAEKVAYAAVRALKQAGFETHVFVLGSPCMAILDTFDSFIDFVHIWDEKVPKWGSDRRFIGHDFIDDNPEVDWKLLKGQLSGFDLVVNNHVMAAHPLMGRLRAEGTRTACYLHVADRTPLGRPAGQPYAAMAFEHAYDAIIACSDQLRRYLMSFGLAGSKIFAVANGPGFALEPAPLAKLRATREGRGVGPLRLLYLGRLDVQKGIDRLHAVLHRLREEGVPFTARVVGGELIADGEQGWTERLSALAEVVPPVFATADLVAHLQWADALLLTSRWEGAPLVTREAQYLGCIPIAANVGAVAEQIAPGRDGLLVDEATDHAMVAGFVRAVRTLLAPETRAALARGAMATCDAHDWRESFAEFVDWASR